MHAWVAVPSRRYQLEILYSTLSVASLLARTFSFQGEFVFSAIRSLPLGKAGLCLECMGTLGALVEWQIA